MRVFAIGRGPGMVWVRLCGAGLSFKRSVQVSFRPDGPAFLFSERQGIKRPLFHVGRWYVFPMQYDPHWYRGRPFTAMDWASYIIAAVMLAGGAWCLVYFIQHWSR